MLYLSYREDIMGYSPGKSVLYFTFTCDGIYPRRVELESQAELTTSWIEASPAGWSCVSSRETFTQSFLRSRRLVRGSRPALMAVAPVFRWLGRRRSLTCSPLGRLAAWPNQRGPLEEELAVHVNCDTRPLIQRAHLPSLWRKQCLQ